MQVAANGSSDGIFALSSDRRLPGLLKAETCSRAGIISHYLRRPRFPLSLRMLEGMLAVRGIILAESLRTGRTLNPTGAPVTSARLPLRPMPAGM